MPMGAVDSIVLVGVCQNLVKARNNKDMPLKGAIFRGTVTKRGGGGFASVRFRPQDPNMQAAGH